MPTDLKRLHEPFPAEDIDWRVQSCGKGQRGPWAKVLAYVTSRAVQDRLDEVVGHGNWQTDIKPIDGGFIAGIGILVNKQWVWKYDGAQTTNIEKIKGGISGAIKRAAVQWGIGRYLYKLREGYADIQPNGVNWQKGKSGEYDAFNWNPPKLPVWALPEGHTMPEGGYPIETEKAPPEGSEEATDEIKNIAEVVADIGKCDNFKHLKNIYDKYSQIFTGESLTVLMRAKDVKKGEIE